MKRNVLIFFGGPSVEHDISIITALQTIQAISQEQKQKNNCLESFAFLPVYISRGGSWFVGEELSNISFYKNFSTLKKGINKVSLMCGENLLCKWTGRKLKPFLRIDMAILCNHGKGGEDGILQGMLESSFIPYSSCNVLSSAVCMDKITLKHILIANGFNQTQFVSFSRKEWQDSPETVIENLKQIEFPVVVKPSNLGSSIGISVCNDLPQLKQAIEVAKAFDSRLIVEKAVQSLREFNCCVMGNSLQCIVSDVEEPIGWEKFLSFNEKYLSNKKTSGMQSSKREYPAKISTDLKNQIQILSKQAFKQLGCKGVVRVDFLWDSNKNQLFLNEINTIPGSLSFYFWKNNNISFGKLVCMLIDFACEEDCEAKKSTTVFNSQALENFSGSKIRK